MAAIPPATAASAAGYGVGQGQLLQHNSTRLVNLATVLATCMQPQAGRSCESFQLFKLFVSLARGIDYAVANNDVPVKAEDLPQLFKQICQPKNDSLLQAAIMVLMLSVKNACKVGWFSDNETQELLKLANEVGSSFCSPGVINSVLSNSQSNISEIMSRYYPLMKMGNILAYLEAKPGYAASIIDFHISKNTVHSPEEKIRLFVAQVDNIETSACIVNPQRVNFLLNGKGVEKRTNVLMDTGPQMPTNVTAMLKYGTNLLQAVGQFNGHYIIVVAYMSVVSLPDAPMLPDYAQSGNLAPESDSDLIEGPSRISLHCPISRTRIKTPVKGITCKHLQCFDFENYVDINTRRPSWRCPHCNQHVCYTDLRIDQNMVKVMREVGEDISEVIISAEGSWKAVLESDDQADHAEEQNHKKDGSQREESDVVSKAAPSILDLTQDDNEKQVDVIEIEDMKPSLDELRKQSTAMNSVQTSKSNTAVRVNQGTAPWMQDEFWSGLVNNTALISSARSNAPTENTQLQQSQLVNSNSNPESGRIHPVPRQVTRVPSAVQALPAFPQKTPQQIPALPQTTPLLIPSTGSSMPTSTSQPFQTTASSTSGLAKVPIEIAKRQQPSRLHNVTASSSQNHSVAQNRNQNSRPSQPGVPASSQHPSTQRISSGLSAEQRIQQLAQQRLSQSRNHPPGPVQSSSPLLRPQSPQGSSQLGQAASASSQYSNDLAAANRAAHRATMMPSRAHLRNVDAVRTQTVEQRGNAGGPPTAVSNSTTATAEMPSDQSSRPAARMRGSLSGKQYSSALSHLMIQPSQSPQGTKPPTNMKSPTSAPPRPIPPGLQQILGSGKVFRFPPTPTNATTGPAGISRNSPPPTSAMTGSAGISGNAPTPSSAMTGLAGTNGNSSTLPEKPGGTR